MVPPKQQIDPGEVKWLTKEFEELTIHELYEILALRQEVYIVEQDCNYQDVDYSDQYAYHLLAYIKGKEGIQGYSRVIGPGKKYKQATFGRLMVKKELRGTGFGRHLMSKTMELLIDKFGRVEVMIDAQSYLEHFYNTYDFKKVGKEFIDEGIPHIKMIWKP